jgi:DNA-binding GntR family transcriptional regulator
MHLQPLLQGMNPMQGGDLKDLASPGHPPGMIGSAAVHSLGELERLCARLAARRITGGQGRMLRAAHDAVIQAASAGPDRFYEANQLFHETIYAASCDAFVTAETRKLRNKVAAYRRRVTRKPGPIEDTIAEHHEIMTAILAHDAEGAHRSIRNHLALIGDDLMDFIASFDRASPGAGPDPNGATLHAGTP